MGLGLDHERITWEEIGIVLLLYYCKSFSFFLFGFLCFFFGVSAIEARSIRLADQWWRTWCRLDVLDMVRPESAADGGGAGARARDLPHPRRRLRPLRGAPRHAPARGQRPHQPPRRQVGAPPPRTHRRLLPRQPQRAHRTACCLLFLFRSTSS
jgi:hypothetical protein